MGSAEKPDKALVTACNSSSRAMFSVSNARGIEVSYAFPILIGNFKGIIVNLKDVFG